MKEKERLIELILKYGIIGTNFKEPITFKSGIKSPIYCNFRKCATHPELRKLIIESFIKIFYSRIDCLFGVPVGAMPYSEVLSYKMNLPSGYVRPDAKAKDHGLKKIIEGYDDISGKRVGLIEDLISTGGSIISNAEILKKHGAFDIILACIFSYEMEESKKEFAEAGLELYSLITIHDILPHLKETLPAKDYESLEDWVRDPRGWFDRHKTEFDFGFLTQLRRSAKDTGSIICMGLDPVIEALPLEFRENGIGGFYEFMKIVFEEFKKQDISPAMFKPNLAWWQVHDSPFSKNYSGSKTLVEMAILIEELFPGIPINTDFKKGDIGTSSAKWAEYGYKKWLTDAATVHTYMGSDSVGPFIKYCNNEEMKGAYLLVKTTNKGSADLQMKKMQNGRFIYEEVAENVINWAKGKPGVGAVTAGNSPEELTILGKMFAGKDIPLLIPGVGPTQGGDAGEVATILKNSGYELALARINLSSGLTHPWYKKPGDPIPNTEECVQMIVNTLRSLNELVGYSD